MRPQTESGPLGDLKGLLYGLYVEAGHPTLDQIAADVAADDLPGAPERDSIHRILSSPHLPPSQADVVTVATVLARRARWDTADAAARARESWVTAHLAATRPRRRWGGRSHKCDRWIWRCTQRSTPARRNMACPSFPPTSPRTRCRPGRDRLLVAGVF
ncbi:hypothetical protein [Nonomuraea sp. NPDC049400]|uniref:hypothetical protein n=1 Tax=Nonomuraea sp. NPDC049400 TaxID=3364352 RepID=UPI00379B5258